MPSKSKKQARLMAGVCHGTIKKKGLSRKVACEFNKADKKTGILKKKRSRRRK